MTTRIGMRLSAIAITLSSVGVAVAQPMQPQPPPPPAALPPATAAAQPPPAQPPPAQPPAAFPPPAALPPPAAAPPPTPQPPGIWSPQPTSEAPAGAIVMPPDYLSEPGRYPRKQPYDEGVRTPVGYHEGKESRRGLFIAGIVTFASVYGGCALVGGAVLAEDNGEGAWLLVPIGGPIAFAADVGSNNSNDRGMIIGMTLLTMGQAAGAALTIAGLAAKRPVWVRNDVVATSDENRSARVAEAIVPTVRVGAGWASVGVEF